MKTIIAICVLLVLLVLAVFGLFWACQRQAEECAKAGGHIGFAGNFIMVWQVTDYKTGQGVMTQQPVYECIVP